MRKLIIIGAGGHGKVIADAAEKMNVFEEILFLDDKKVNESVVGFKVIDMVANKSKFKETHEFIVAIGDNETRMSIQSELEEQKYKLSTIIHPNVIIGKEVRIGKGTVVMAGVVINSSTKIGNGCIINTSSTVDHDCILEAYVHLSPKVSLSGNVIVEKFSWIGTGTTIINNINITNNVIIGSSSNVVKNITKRGLYFGNPAKKKERH